MADLERIWRGKSDDDLLEAAESLDDYTEEGRRIILAEIERRGLDVSDTQGADGDGGEEGQEVDEGGEALPEDPLTCLRCGVKLQHLGRRHVESLGELGPMLEGRYVLEAYACPECGHVDLFTHPVVEST